MEPLLSDDESNDDDSVVSVDEEEERWTRYEGNDPQLQLVNAAAETWSDWVPETPVQAALKQAIDGVNDVISV